MMEADYEQLNKADTIARRLEIISKQSKNVDEQLTDRINTLIGNITQFTKGNYPDGILKIEKDFLLLRIDIFTFHLQNNTLEVPPNNEFMLRQEIGTVRALANRAQDRSPLQEYARKFDNTEDNFKIIMFREEWFKYAGPQYQDELNGIRNRVHNTTTAIKDGKISADDKQNYIDTLERDIFLARLYILKDVMTSVPREYIDELRSFIAEANTTTYSRELMFRLNDIEYRIRQASIQN